jgi:SAM-dependent methyltransferase
MSNEYYYNETVTRFYDPVYNSMDSLKSGHEFYLDEIKNTSGPVLEAGVGTGRIFIPALQGGADIYGIDYSENMLIRLKEKISPDNYSRLSQNDIRDFSIDKKFQLVISPFRVFQHLLTVEDQLKTLNCIYEHMEEGGRLIFDVFNPDFRRMIKPADNLLEFDGEYEPGQSLKRYCTVKYDHTEQQMNIKFVFVWVENGVVKTDTFSTPLRYYFRYELENLIGRTKFKLEKIYGDFSRGELNEKSNEFILVCRK